jgi:hypothetical protein
MASIPYQPNWWQSTGNKGARLNPAPRETHLVKSIVRKESPYRSKINMQHPIEVKCWTKELGISKAELRAVVDKVGNSASAVRKELASRCEG